MRRKRKRKAIDGGAGSEPPAPAGVSTSIGPLLQRAGLEKLAREPEPTTLPPPGPARAPTVPEPRPQSPPPRPRAAYGAGELAALNDAYRGVRPIARPKRGRALPTVADRAPAVAPGERDEAAARERLAALVSGGVRFNVHWDDGLVEGLRAGVSPKLLRRVTGAGFEPEATFDLHGLRRGEAVRAVHEFVREARRRGARYLLLIVGKGHHSEDGIGVLAEVAVEALTQGVAAPLVGAFASAHSRHGGRGALAVVLD